MKLLGNQSSLSITTELSDNSILLEPREDFDSCIIGVCGDGGAIYDSEKIIDVLIEEYRAGSVFDDETEEGLFEIALDHYCYNIIGSFFGGDVVNPTYTEI